MYRVRVPGVTADLRWAGGVMPWLQVVGGITDTLRGA
jgi:hypothetical protein